METTPPKWHIRVQMQEIEWLPFLRINLFCACKRPGKNPKPKPPTPSFLRIAYSDDNAAATAVQRVYRGRAARDAEEERRRMGQLQAHMERGELVAALKLATSQKERDLIEAKQVAHPSLGICARMCRPASVADQLRLDQPHSRPNP